MEDQNISDEMDDERGVHDQTEDQPNDGTWNWITGHNNLNHNQPSREDQWTSFMFGSRNAGNTPPQGVNQQGHNFNQSNIDFGELMYNIDTLMTSVQNLKPLFQKYYPYLQQLWKKK